MLLHRLDAQSIKVLQKYNRVGEKGRLRLTSSSFHTIKHTSLRDYYNNWFFVQFSGIFKIG